MILPIIALLAPVALALPSITFLRTSTSKVQCLTSYGSSSRGLVGTTTQTQTATLLPWIATSVSTPVSTLTPAPTTTTVTSTSTVTTTITNPTITDTFSTTSTVVTTATTQTTTTSTETDTQVTTTTVTATTTVPTPAGFQPVQDTTATAFPQKRDVERPQKRDSTRDLLERSGKPVSFCKNKPKPYVQSVKCIDHVYIINEIIFVKIAPTSTTTLHPVTLTSTSTVTTTSTSTVVPADASTTLSFATTLTTTTTLTASETDTTTATSTVTGTSTSSYYAACATDGPNYLTQINGGLVDHSTGTGGENFGSANSAYDCCVQCITGTNCIGTYFGVASGNDAGDCVLITSASNTCGAQSQSNDGYYAQANPDLGPYSVSNGLCGYLYYAGTG